MCLLQFRSRFCILESAWREATGENGFSVPYDEVRSKMGTGGSLGWRLEELHGAIAVHKDVGGRLKHLYDSSLVNVVRYCPRVAIGERYDWFSSFETIPLTIDAKLFEKAGDLVKCSPTAIPSAPV